MFFNEYQGQFMQFWCRKLEIVEVNKLWSMYGKESENSSKIIIRTLGY